MIHRKENGQAMAETAIFSLLAVLLAFGMLALIPLHRVRTAATSAAFACAQFVSQALDPVAAVRQAELVGYRSLRADWSASFGAAYEVEAWAGGPGAAGGCSVDYRSPVLFNELLGFAEPGWRTVTFQARSEAWKARWP